MIITLHISEIHSTQLIASAVQRRQLYHLQDIFVLITWKYSFETPFFNYFACSETGAERHGNGLRGSDDTGETHGPHQVAGGRWEIPHLAVGHGNSEARVLRCESNSSHSVPVISRTSSL